jgi:hypothetical protein
MTRDTKLFLTTAWRGKTEAELIRVRVSAVFEYQGKKYPVDFGDRWEYESVQDARYDFEYGDFSCDCNRADFIELGEELPCGNKIKMDNLVLSIEGDTVAINTADSYALLA